MELTDLLPSAITGVMLGVIAGFTTKEIPYVKDLGGALLMTTVCNAAWAIESDSLGAMGEELGYIMEQDLALLPSAYIGIKIGRLLGRLYEPRKIKEERNL